MKPTPAQIKAAGIDAVKDELDFQRSKGSIKADGLEWVLSRITAAAEVGECKPWRITDLMLAEALDREKTVEARTIERCAQVADTFDAELDPATYTASDIAAAIRALKGRP